MILEQFYLSCLSQASYLVADEDSGRAIVVDPRRDVVDYLDFAARRHLTIELVLLTHVHADFVPGYAELALATGAAVAMSELAPVAFPIRRLVDGERITLGDDRTGVAVEVMATPGHTPESVTYAIFTEAADLEPAAVLTGDTLFIGDVGRPDLLGSMGRTAQEMARELYRSLHTRLLPLSDDVLVYPGHGAGSACGKAMSSSTVSTIGEQRQENYALQPMSEDAFVVAVTTGLAEPPAYFATGVALNRAGHAPFAQAAPPEMSVESVIAAVADGALLLDIRDAQEFAGGHLVGAVNVGLAGRFAEFAAAVHTPGQTVIITGPGEDLCIARTRLARVGIDNVIGSLPDPAALLRSRPELSRCMSRLSATQARTRLQELPDLQVVDVRGMAEHADGALPRAVNLPLPRLRERVGDLDPTRPVLIHCASGYRSAAAASLLRAQGFIDVSDLLGGYVAWEAAAVA